MDRASGIRPRGTLLSFVGPLVPIRKLCAGSGINFCGVSVCLPANVARDVISNLRNCQSAGIHRERHTQRMRQMHRHRKRQRREAEKVREWETDVEARKETVRENTEIEKIDGGQPEKYTCRRSDRDSQMLSQADRGS